jgi:uncharacterized protein (TIGR03118 family)
MQRRTFAFTSMLGLVLMFLSSAALAQYQLTNLVSNQFGQAKNDDPLIVNAWGLVHAPTSPFWISDNGSGWSTLYNGSGSKQNLNVEIPPTAGGSIGTPTGVVFNGSSQFQVNGSATFFIFATLDGTISAWAPAVDLNNATIKVDNSASGGVLHGPGYHQQAFGEFSVCGRQCTQ